MKSLLITGVLIFISLILPKSLFAQDTDDTPLIYQQNHYQDTLAPHFALTDVNGNLWCSDSLKGKVIVLNLWSIYCPPCFHELPELNKIPAQFSTDSVIFISVLFEKSAKADSIIARNHFNYHIVEGGQQIASDYYNNCFPTHIIIDREGMIRYNICGQLNSPMLVPEIRKVLKQ